MFCNDAVFHAAEHFLEPVEFLRGAVRRIYVFDRAMCVEFAETWIEYKHDERGDEGRTDDVHDADEKENQSHAEELSGQHDKRKNRKQNDFDCLLRSKEICHVQKNIAQYDA